MYDIDGDGKADVAIYGASDVPPAKTVATYLFKIGTDIYLSDGENGGYITPYKPYTDRGEIKFDEGRDYFYPIPLDDRSLNHNLTQNPGWDDGLNF